MERCWRAIIPLALLVTGVAGQAQPEAPGPLSVMEGPVTEGPMTNGSTQSLPSARIDEELAIGGEEIEARKLRSRMTVEVGINGKGPYNFVVDSGADTSAVGTALAGKLALPEGSPALLHGVTESKIVERVLVDELRLGPTVATDLQVPVLDERDMGGDGMIGLDALVNQRLMLDFEKRVISIDDGLNDRGKGAVREDGVIVVTGRLRRGQLILTEVAAGNQRVQAVVDTGSEVTIGNLALRDKLLRKRRGKAFDTITVHGVTGAAMDIEFTVIPRLRLGSVMLQNVPIAFADIPPFELFGLHKKPSLLLGTDLMETFRRVSLDFHERKVRFQLRKCKRSGVLIRTSPSSARLSSNDDRACAR